MENTTNEYSTNEEINLILYKLFRLGWENKFAHKGELMEIFDSYRIKEKLNNRLQLKSNTNDK